MDAVISSPTLDTRRPTAIAVMAMGGQGGGVLVDWIVALIEGQGWLAQSTSVPGVAQRTGATIYYVEAIESDGSGRRPVLSLMPVPGEVDIVIGAELMEAGRAMQRGLVSPDRTTLIASSHRAYAVSEKIAPGDGAGDPAKVHEAARAASKQFLAFDMATIAEQSESVISAALFGALAASGALPFPRAAYEATIRETGVGVEASLRAFGRAYDAAVVELKSPTPAPSGNTARKEFPDLKPIGDAGFDALIERARKLPEPVHGMVAAGLARVVDFQDQGYGSEYLDRVNAFAEIGANALTSAAAKQIARAMAYDDVIRVADLKTLRPGPGGSGRQARPDRLRDRVHASAHGRGLRHAAGRAGTLDRIEPPRPGVPASSGRSRPAGSVRYDRLVPDALSIGGPAEFPPWHAAPSP
jgi:indolepyruvate ferredoxin oxidoreductase beta subunit